MISYKNWRGYGNDYKLKNFHGTIKQTLKEGDEFEITSVSVEQDWNAEVEFEFKFDWFNELEQQ